MGQGCLKPLSAGFGVGSTETSIMRTPYAVWEILPCLRCLPCCRSPCLRSPLPPRRFRWSHRPRRISRLIRPRALARGRPASGSPTARREFASRLASTTRKLTTPPAGRPSTASTTNGPHSACALPRTVRQLKSPASPGPCTGSSIFPECAHGSAPSSHYNTTQGAIMATTAEGPTQGIPLSPPSPPFNGPLPPSQEPGKKRGSPLRLGVTRALQSRDCPAISRVPGDSSDVEGCTQLERLLPCPFRRPSMAGGRRPLAATPLHHKHGETSAREDDRKPAAQADKPGARTHAAIGPLAGCLGPRCHAVATTASLWGEGPPSQGPDSPPNDEESQKRTRIIIAAIVAGIIAIIAAAVVVVVVVGNSSGHKTGPVVNAIPHINSRSALRFSH